MNKNGIFMRNAGAIKWQTNKEKHCTLATLLYRAVIFPCVQQLIIFLCVCPAFWKASMSWEWGWCLVPSMEKRFDRRKNRISLFFGESPHFFTGLQIFLYQGLAGLGTPFACSTHYYRFCSDENADYIIHLPTVSISG